jgi:transcriptional regulator with XRE-family HTH domain
MLSWLPTLLSFKLAAHKLPKHKMIPNFPLRLKQLREMRGWTQDHLAQLASIDPRTVARLEAGENDPSPESRKALAQAFDCTVEDLLYAPTKLATPTKTRNYILEIYFEGECIEQRRSAAPFIVPDVGDEMYIEFANPNYSRCHGFYWKVNRKRHIKFAEDLELETVMLYCTPCAPE